MHMQCRRRIPYLDSVLRGFRGFLRGFFQKRALLRGGQDVEGAVLRQQLHPHAGVGAAAAVAAAEGVSEIW